MTRLIINKIGFPARKQCAAISRKQSVAGNIKKTAISLHLLREHSVVIRNAL